MRHRPRRRSTRRLVALAIAAPCAAVACGHGQKPASETNPAKSAQCPDTRPRPAQRDVRPVVALGDMMTVAGGGTQLGDGGPATAAGLCEATDVARDRHGNLYIADAGLYCDGPGGNSIRKVDPA